MVDYSFMRRSDREILDFAEIVDVLRRADVIRLGLNGDPYPYVVPLSFGFEVLDAEGGVGGAGSAGSVGGIGGNHSNRSNRRGIAIYVHGAAAGLKHELIASDNHVCVEADIFHGNLMHGEENEKSITAQYESVIGFGIAEIVGGAAAERGVGIILGHYGYDNFAYDKTILKTMKVFKISLVDIKGKRNI